MSKSIIFGRSQNVSSLYRLLRLKIMRDKYALGWELIVHKFNIFTFLILILMLAVGLSIGAAQAATLTVVDGKLTGATGVTVGSNVYDVIFLDGTCFSIFDGCDNEFDDFDFNDVSSAKLAAQALFDQVLIDGPDGSFDTIPSLTAGCESGPLDCTTIIPYDAHTASVFLVAAPQNTDSFDNIVTFSFLTLTDTNSEARYNFADFTLVSTVPIPPTILLFASSLLGLGAVTWRRHLRPNGDQEVR